MNLLFCAILLLQVSNASPAQHGRFVPDPLWPDRYDIQLEGGTTWGVDFFAQCQIHVGDTVVWTPSADGSKGTLYVQPTGETCDATVFSVDEPHN
jgi:hypothetical protein